MDAATTVWVGLSIAAPVTLVPSIALLRLLHSSRVSCRPLDILIVTLLVAQLAATLLTLGFSATTLLRSAGLLDTLLTDGIRSPVCATLVSSWSAAHTLHATTLASVAVDRLLTIRWPYKYRLSVRRTQVRYHVVVLSIISILVGVATLFAGSNGVSSDTCVLLPHLLDTRFALFFACLHGALFLATLAATLAILVTGNMIRCCGSDMIGSGSDLRTLGTISDASATSGTLTTQVAKYGGSTPVASLTRATSAETTSPQRTRIEVSGRNRNRHYTVAAVLVVSYLTYHLPILALTIIGSSFEWILPKWPYPAMVLGLGLIQSVLVMVVLVSIDPFIQAWIKESLRRPTPSRKFQAMQRPSSLSCEDLTSKPNISTLKIDEERNFRIGLYSHDTTETKFPLTNGSLFAHLVSPPPTDGARVRRTSRLGVCSLPSPTSAEPPSLSTFQSRPPAPRIEPLYSDPLPSLQTSFSNHTTRGQFSEPIYATLSETLSSLQKVSLQENDDSEDSATESAGEDFEFHDIRLSRQTLAHEDVADGVDSKPRTKLNRSATYKVSCNVTSSPQISCSNGVTCVKLEFPSTDPIVVEDLTLKRSKLVTSLSMNDIDIVGTDVDSYGTVPKFEAKFQIHSSQMDLSVQSASIHHGHLRQKSIDRPKIHSLHVSLDALHKALNDSHRSFLDTGDLDPLKNVNQEKTVFVSEYL